MIVGFTGTQIGLNLYQLDQLDALFKTGNINELHHGDCIGADEDADLMAREYNVRIAVHPPTIDRKRAFCYKLGDRLFVPLPYMDRNRQIVNMTEMLIAAPRRNDEVVRSGTWATVRYARSIGRQVVVLERSR